MSACSAHCSVRLQQRGARAPPQPPKSGFCCPVQWNVSHYLKPLTSIHDDIFSTIQRGGFSTSASSPVFFRQSRSLENHLAYALGHLQKGSTSHCSQAPVVIRRITSRSMQLQMPEYYILASGILYTIMYLLSLNVLHTANMLSLPLPAGYVGECMYTELSK